jgi:hypothetical protein
MLNLQEFFICRNELINYWIDMCQSWWWSTVFQFLFSFWGCEVLGRRGVWHDEQCFFFSFLGRKDREIFPQVMGHRHSPVWDPGTTKGPWFEPRGVQATLLPAICQGGANDLSGPVCCCASKGEKDWETFGWFVFLV